MLKRHNDHYRLVVVKLSSMIILSVTHSNFVHIQYHQICRKHTCSHRDMSTSYSHNSVWLSTDMDFRLSPERLLQHWAIIRRPCKLLRQLEHPCKSRRWRFGHAKANCSKWPECIPPLLWKLNSVTWWRVATELFISSHGILYLLCRHIILS